MAPARCRCPPGVPRSRAERALREAGDPPRQDQRGELVDEPGIGRAVHHLVVERDAGDPFQDLPRVDVVGQVAPAGRGQKHRRVRGLVRAQQVLQLLPRRGVAGDVGQQHLAYQSRDHVDDDRDHRADVARGVPGGLHRLAELAADHLQHQERFARPPPVHGRLGDTGPGGDALDRELVEPHLAQRRQGRIDDRLVGVRAAFAPCLYTGFGHVPKPPSASAPQRGLLQPVPQAGVGILTARSISKRSGGSAGSRNRRRLFRSARCVRPLPARPRPIGNTLREHSRSRYVVSGFPPPVCSLTASTGYPKVAMSEPPRALYVHSIVVNPRETGPPAGAMYRTARHKTIRNVQAEGPGAVLDTGGWSTMRSTASGSAMAPLSIATRCTGVLMVAVVIALCAPVRHSSARTVPIAPIAPLTLAVAAVLAAHDATLPSDRPAATRAIDELTARLVDGRTRAALP